MKTSQFSILLLIGILLTAFITNPDRKKHSEKATEILFDVNEDDENYGILGGLIGSFSTSTIEGNIKIKDYYLFSKSYIYSPSRNKKLDLGLGFLGKVIPLSDYTDVQKYLDEGTKNLENRSEEVSIYEKQNEETGDSKPDLNQDKEASPERMIDKEKQDAILNSILGKPEDSQY